MFGNILIHLSGVHEQRTKFMRVVNITVIVMPYWIRNLHPQNLCMSQHQDFNQRKENKKEGKEIGAHQFIIKKKEK